MNYDQQLNNISIQLKADKGLHVKWRNKAISRIDDVQAMIRMAKTTSGALPPHDVQEPMHGTVPHRGVEATNNLPECICPPGAVDGTCPQHGTPTTRV